MQGEKLKSEKGPTLTKSLSLTKKGWKDWKLQGEKLKREKLQGEKLKREKLQGEKLKSEKLHEVKLNPSVKSSRISSEDSSFDSFNEVSYFQCFTETKVGIQSSLYFSDEHSVLDWC